MHDENYLIICRSDFEARRLLLRVANYLHAHGVTNMKVHEAHRVITTTVPNEVIRFTSQTKAYEDCRGFRGTIRNGYEVDKFLDPWEMERARRLSPDSANIVKF